MFYRCERCGLAFFFTASDNRNQMLTRHFLTCGSDTFASIRVEANSTSSRYSECGGEIEGIQTETTIETSVDVKVKVKI